MAGNPSYTTLAARSRNWRPAASDDTERWADQERDLDEERYNRELLRDEGPEPGTHEWRCATGNYVDPEPVWGKGEPYVDHAHGTMFWDTAKGMEADGPIDWQKVYGDGYEERIWDGRGLDVNDALAKAEPEREAGQ